MQFLYNENAKNELISLENEDFKHLKARRVKENECLKLSNLQDDFLYLYKISKLNKNSCILELLSKEKSHQKQSKLKLALGVIDVKILEKTLPFLNELGVLKLFLVFTEFSQRNFKISLQRLDKIIIQSCQQCGRVQKMQIELFESVKEFHAKFSDAILLDFGAENSENFSEDEIYFIGCEGGFSESERKLFQRKISLKTDNILKAQTAIIGVASKILL